MHISGPSIGLRAVAAVIVQALRKRGEVNLPGDIGSACSCRASSALHVFSGRSLVFGAPTVIRDGMAFLSQMNGTFKRNHGIDG
jgi:hypothetical protein